MAAVRDLLILCLFVTVLCSGQVPTDKSAPQTPSLPVIDYDACPFEGCTFGKWIVNRNSMVFSSWKADRKPVFTLKKGEVVTGLTGVHITYEPDRIQVLKLIPELRLEPGDIIFRYNVPRRRLRGHLGKGPVEKRVRLQFRSGKKRFRLFG